MSLPVAAVFGTQDNGICVIARVKAPAVRTAVDRGSTFPVRRQGRDDSEVQVPVPDDLARIAGVQEAFDESFPTFVRYARARGVQVPAYFDGPAPWANKAAFLADRSGKVDAMRRWLAAHVEIQTQFIMARSRMALRRMMQHSSNPQAVASRYQALAATTQGMYCLVDYVNFKGEGTKPTERYKGQGWGLLQVLEEMRGYPTGRAATAEFSRAAGAVLTRRVQNSPASRGEQRWLPGWLNRCKTYR